MCCDIHDTLWTAELSEGYMQGRNGEGCFHSCVSSEQVASSLQVCPKANASQVSTANLHSMSVAADFACCKAPDAQSCVSYTGTGSLLMPQRAHHMD